MNGLVDKVSDMTTDAGSPEAAATADDVEDKPQQSKKPSRAQKRRVSNRNLAWPAQFKTSASSVNE